MIKMMRFWKWSCFDGGTGLIKTFDDREKKVEGNLGTKNYQDAFFL